MQPQTSAVASLTRLSTAVPSLSQITRRYQPRRVRLCGVDMGDDETKAQYVAEAWRRRIPNYRLLREHPEALPRTRHRAPELAQLDDVDDDGGDLWGRTAPKEPQEAPQEAPGTWSPRLPVSLPFEYTAGPVATLEASDPWPPYWPREWYNDEDPDDVDDEPDPTELEEEFWEQWEHPDEDLDPYLDPDEDPDDQADEDPRTLAFWDEQSRVADERRRKAEQEQQARDEAKRERGEMLRSAMASRRYRSATARRLRKQRERDEDDRRGGPRTTHVSGTLPVFPWQGVAVKRWRPRE